MNLLSAFTQPTYVEVATFALNFLVQATLILGLGLIAEKGVSRFGAASQKLVLRLTLVALLLCPMFAGALKQANVSGWGWRFESAGLSSAKIVATERDRFVSGLQGRDAFQIDIRHAAYSSSTREHSEASADHPLAGHIAGFPGIASEDGPATTIGQAGFLFPVLFWTWAVVAVLLFGRIVVANVLMIRLRRLSKPATEADIEQLKSIAVSMGLGRIPELRLSEDIGGPCLFGVLRPVILVRTNDKTVPREVLLHELEHFRGQDCFWQILSRCVAALIWMQPLAWLLVRRIDLVGDEVADDRVLESGVDRNAYARCLVELAENQSRHLLSAGAVAGMAQFKSHLAARVARIVAPRTSVSVRIGQSFALVAILASSITSAAVAMAMSGGEESGAIKKGGSSSNAVASPLPVGNVPRNAKLQWQFKLEKGYFEGSPAADGSILCVADSEGGLHALDINTGDKLWKYQGTDAFFASPAIADGKVLIGDASGRMHCVDFETGTLLWSYATQGEIAGSAVVADGKVVLGSADANLYCLSAESGKLLWKFESGDQILSTPVIAGDTVIIAGCDAKMHLIDLESGKQTGEVSLGTQTGASPAVVDNMAYIARYEESLLAVNWQKLSVVWEGAETSGRNSAVARKDLLIYPSEERQVLAVDPDSQERLWQFTSKTKIRSTPVLAGDCVIVNTVDGRVYCLSLKTGEAIWDFQCVGGLQSSPAVSQGKVILASDKGIVYCLGD